MKTENILEGAKFGDRFVTRDGQNAVFVGKYDKSWWKIVIEGEDEIRTYRKNCKPGMLTKSDGNFPLDIVSKFIE